MKKLLLGLALVLPIVAVPQGAQAAAKVTVSPSTVLPRVAPCGGVNTFTVSGRGFKPYETIDLAVGGLAYGSMRADGAGGYRKSAEIKAVPSGYYPVKLAGRQGSKAQAKIRIGWAGCWTRSHGVLTVRGAGFAPTDAIDIILDDEIVAVAHSDARGRFESKVDCPQGDPTLSVEGDEHALDFGVVDC
ncbi:hypothetical protein [Actinoplanes sp. NPDC049265]|uniref:hypothetical protein n=1 Tax=Actinoplanes sp. NPDC049265 TaxID=3363902 RepID=UPI0037171C6C